MRSGARLSNESFFLAFDVFEWVRWVQWEQANKIKPLILYPPKKSSGYSGYKTR